MLPRIRPLHGRFVCAVFALSRKDHRAMSGLDTGPFAIGERCLVPFTDKHYEAKVLKAEFRLAGSAHTLPLGRVSLFDPHAASGRTGCGITLSITTAGTRSMTRGSRTPGSSRCRPRACSRPRCVGHAPCAMSRMDVFLLSLCPPGAEDRILSAIARRGPAAAAAAALVQAALRQRLAAGRKAGRPRPSA